MAALITKAAEADAATAKAARLDRKASAVRNNACDTDAIAGAGAGQGARASEVRGRERSHVDAPWSFGRAGTISEFMQLSHVATLWPF
jgi:hypothetical protein